MLEDASGTVCALAWVFQEILTDWREILSTQGFLLLKFLLSMGETASLFLELVLTLKALQPEPTQFGLDLTLPWIFLLDISLLRSDWVHVKGWRLLILDGLSFTDTFKGAFNDLVIRNLFLIWVAVAASGRSNGAACLGSLLAKEWLVLCKLQVKHWNLFGRHFFPHHLWWSRNLNEVLLLVKRAFVMLEARLFW